MNNIKPIGEHIDVTAEKILAIIYTEQAARLAIQSPRALFMFWCRLKIDFATGSVVRAVRIVESAPEIASQEDAAEVVRLSQAADDDPRIAELQPVKARVQYANIPEWNKGPVN